MQRWLLFLVTGAGIVLVAMSICFVRERRAHREQDVAYQMVLRSYSEVLMPGMTRKEVEDYLHARNVSFRMMCCVDPKQSAKHVYDDLTKIGQEDAPWVCSEKNIYIAFQFKGTDSNEGRPTAEASDTLSAVSLYTWLEGCP